MFDYLRLNVKNKNLRDENESLKDQLDRCIDLIKSQRDVLLKYYDYAKEADEIIHKRILLNKNEDIPEAF